MLSEICCSRRSSATAIGPQANFLRTTNRITNTANVQIARSVLNCNGFGLLSGSALALALAVEPAVDDAALDSPSAARASPTNDTQPRQHTKPRHATSRKRGRCAP